MLKTSGRTLDPGQGDSSVGEEINIFESYPGLLLNGFCEAATTSCKIVETLSLKNTFSSFQCPPHLEFKPFPLPLPPPPFNVDCLSSQHFFVLLATLIRGGGGLQCER